MDLVILAAGMGSRFGGLKQLEPMDDYGNYIIDYSIFDAISSGFERAVFIIRKENEKAFRETIGKRIESRIRTEYVFQENDSVPDDRIPSERTKPLGTAHAILCCKDVVNSPFMIINADDFYGRTSYKVASEFIKKGCNEKTFGCVAYEAGKTITDSGSVKRGVCSLSENNIIEITESSISKTEKGLKAEPLDGSPEFMISDDAPVSMNMFVLSPSVFKEFEKRFFVFLENMKNPMKDEYLLPDVVSELVHEGKAVLKSIKSKETWYGMTYPGDKEMVCKAIRSLVDCNTYPNGLW